MHTVQPYPILFLLVSSIVGFQWKHAKLPILVFVTFMEIGVQAHKMKSKSLKILKRSDAIGI